MAEPEFALKADLIPNPSLDSLVLFPEHMLSCAPEQRRNGNVAEQGPG